MWEKNVTRCPQFSDLSSVARETQIMNKHPYSPYLTCEFIARVVRFFHLLFKFQASCWSETF